MATKKSSTQGPLVTLTMQQYDVATLHLVHVESLVEVLHDRAHSDDGDQTDETLVTLLSEQVHKLRNALTREAVDNG